MAWAAHRRGWAITLVDQPSPESCSRVAAGLVTPITGSRAAASWQWSEYYPFAAEHYLACEAATGERFWFSKPALRIFQSQAERERSIDRWVDREEGSSDSALPRMTLCSHEELVGYTAPWGGAWMEPAARLDTQTYLDATLQWMQTEHAVLKLELQLGPHTLQQQSSGIEVSGLEGLFDTVVLCQGFASRDNPWFASLPLHPARGDILTVKFPESQLDPERYPHVVHASSWLVPLGDGRFLTGATYDRKTLDGIVDDRESVQQAQRDVLHRMQEYIGEPSASEDRGASDDMGVSAPVASERRVELVGQRAAVRPASYDRHPLIGRHPVKEHLFVLNGLGSKGTLMSPRLAHHLCDLIEHGKEIEFSLDWMRKFPRQE